MFGAIAPVVDDVCDRDRSDKSAAAPVGDSDRSNCPDLPDCPDRSDCPDGFAVRSSSGFIPTSLPALTLVVLDALAPAMVWVK